MSIARTLDLVHDAQQGRYAVPAVNIVDEVSIRATIAAAEQHRSPVILQTSVKTVKQSGPQALHAIFVAAAAHSSIPVSLHLDHCPDPSVITDVIDAGWSSVLYDASHLDLADATSSTVTVVHEAHNAGVAVESEIENIVGVEDGVGSDEATHAYGDEELVEIARETGVDILAPALGTAHGLYSAAPVLRIDRAAHLRELTDLPLVLHGGTGLSEADFRGFVDAGISKINISTALKRAYMLAAKEHLAEAERSGKWEPTALFRAIHSGVERAIGEHIRYFGSAGRVHAGVGAEASA